MFNLSLLGIERIMLLYYEVYIKNIKVFLNENIDNINKISYGNYHAIIVCNDGVYFCGKNDDDSVDIDDIEATLYPVKLDFFDGKIIRKISCGYNHTVAVCDDGVYAWGRNDRGQLGKGDTKLTLSPFKLEFFNSKIIRKISCGYAHTIAVCNDGVFVWGINDEGQLGIPNIQFRFFPSKSQPTRLKFFDDKVVSKISCGLFHNIVVCNDGVYAWGRNDSGQLGKGDIRPSSTPFKLDFFDNKIIFNIACGGNHTIAVCDDGVYVWGHNYFRQLGKGDTENALSPVRLDFFDGKDVHKISCGGWHSIAICSDGIYAWGWNKHDALNLGHNRQVSSPEKITGIDFDVENVYCGYHNTFLKKAKPMVKAAIAPVMSRV